MTFLVSFTGVTLSLKLSAPTVLGIAVSVGVPVFSGVGLRPGGPTLFEVAVVLGTIGGAAEDKVVTEESVVGSGGEMTFSEIIGTIEDTVFKIVVEAFWITVEVSMTESTVVVDRKFETETEELVEFSSVFWFGLGVIRESTVLFDFKDWLCGFVLFSVPSNRFNTSSSSSG